MLERAAGQGGKAGAAAARVIDSARFEADGDAKAAQLLTPKQLDVLVLVERGASNKAIARALGISITTVKTHLRDAFGRLGASSRTEAVARARDLGCL
jgi:DNA-binding NarL/FixJ family response regulator